jgi:hypothetical protein
MRFTSRLSLLFLFAAVVLAAGCDCAGPAPAGRCDTSTDCTRGANCVDHRCITGVDTGVQDGGVDAPGADAPSTCTGGATACGALCCAEAEICGTNLACCARADLCGSTCCGAGEVCEGAVCRIACGANARCEDASGDPVCCAAGEVCASSQCFAPTTPCTDFIDCAEGEYCEPTLGQCLPQPGGEECASHPTGGAVVPTLLWAWDGTGAALPEWNQVMMAPMVANLTDDNSDGAIDEDDVPDVVFGTFCGIAGPCAVGNYRDDGVLRAVSGSDGSSVFDVTDPTMRINPGGQVAIGDLDGDGLVEIVACESDATVPVGLGQLIAFHHDGSFYWRSADARVVCAEAAPAIADLDADGHPEVFVRYTVVSGQTGAVVWHHECVGTGDWATDAHNPCDYTTAADLDGDHRLEVVGGNVAYHGDTGAVLWDRTADFLDGYPAIGDLDRDGDPEVVVMHSAFTPAPYQGEHFLRALNGLDGSDVWPAPVDVNQGRAPAADVASGAVGGGGPPTIANFDDDPLPEIALAGAYAFVVFEPDGTARWTAPTQDHSSRKTGSSVFDFDGDGVAEAVYNDEYWLRVYDGRDGTVRFCECNTSATLWEYPVIVDVDNDAHAEIVLASNNYGGAFTTCAVTPDLGACELDRIAAGENLGTHGIRVLASPTRDWVATRRIWNEHTYHVTNVSESGAIPRVEGDNWTTRGLNDFRQNVQPGAANVPDLVPTDLAVDLTMCGASMTLNFRVTNEGWAASEAGVPVTIYVEEGGTFVRIGRVVTTRALLPGESEALSIPYDLAGRLPSETIRFRVVVNDASDTPDPDLLECRPGNNEAETTASCSILI